LLATAGNYVVMEPGVLKSPRAQGKYLRSDLRRISRAASEHGRDIVITEGWGGKASWHHDHVARYDIRIIGLTEPEITSLKTALEHQGFQVHREGPPKYVAHLHIWRD